MKKYLTAAVTCFAVCSLFLGVQTASAALVSYSTGFTTLGDPEEAGVFITASGFGGNAITGYEAFGMYVLGDSEPGYPDNAMTLLRGSGEPGFSLDPITSGILTFEQEGGIWTANYDHTGDGNPDDSLELGTQAVWGFYFYYEATVFYYDRYYLNELSPLALYRSDETGEGAGFVLNFEGMEATVGGASPIPVPSAFLLLGTGLAGLVGFRRRRSAR